ncbi:MAG: DUF4386 family protein [Roseiflexaceae bacterium]|nr:DUF4386 family protein [Roseiflexaceae bacterium]
MSAILSSATSTNSSQPVAAPTRLTGLSMALVVVSFLVCLGILSSAINWPVSLDYPASTMLPLLVEQRGAVLFGYSLYFLSAVLIIPMALLLQRVLDPQRQSVLISIATVFGILAGVVKPFGIIRWLVAMPTLAQAYVDPNANEASRQTISLIFTTLNTYAGALGELLGVALLGGLWALLIGVALLRLKWDRGILAWTGVLVGLAALLPIAEIYGINLGPILTISNAAWYLWVLGFGITLLRQR